MDTYEGSIYDPDTLHKYLYANGNPVTYSDPSGNFSCVAQAAAMAINDVITSAYNLNLIGLISGASNMAISAVLGKEGTDLVKSFYDGYLSGIVFAGLTYFAAIIKAYMYVKAFGIAFTGAFNMAMADVTFGMSLINVVASSVMFIGSIMKHNDKETLVYGAILIVSLFGAAAAYDAKCSITVAGDKGTATIEFDGSGGDAYAVGDATFMDSDDSF